MQGQVSRDSTGSTHLILSQKDFFSVTTKLKLYCPQIFLIKVAMILGDLFNELFRHLCGVGHSHGHFRTVRDRNRWLKSLKTEGCGT